MNKLQNNRLKFAEDDDKSEEYLKLKSSIIKDNKNKLQLQSNNVLNMKNLLIKLLITKMKVLIID